MSILDKWKCQAKEPIEHYVMAMEVGELHERILALIELVRKKDEALKEISSQSYEYPEDNMIDVAHEALALTDELK